MINQKIIILLKSRMVVTKQIMRKLKSNLKIVLLRIKLKNKMMMAGTGKTLMILKI